MLNFREYSYLVESAFASWEYTPPTSDPEKIMMDFYTFLNLDNESLITGKIEGAKLSDEDYEKKEVERRTKSEMRLKLSENLTFVKNYNFDKLIEYLRTEFLKVLPFAVAAEFRHIFDDNGPEPLKSFFQKNFGEIGLKFITNYAMTYHARSKGWSRQASENEANRKKEETASYVTSYIAIKNGLKKTGMNWEQFMKIANKCFTGLQWSQSYGGTNWANISHAYSKLANAPDRPSKAIWIDHVYDLEHNTGSVFTKVKRYRKGGTYEWIKKALDFKAKLETPKDFNKLVQKASMDLQAFVWAYIFSQYDVTKEDITGEKAKQPRLEKLYADVRFGDTDSGGNFFSTTSDGSMLFWKNKLGQYNKYDGPAVVDENGIQYWYNNGSLHRWDGPAIVNPKNHKEDLFYIHGRQYSTEDLYKKKIAELKQQELDYFNKNKGNGPADALAKAEKQSGKKSSDEEWKEFSSKLFPPKSVTPSKKYTNAEYEKMSYDEIYSEYKNGDKDEDGNKYYISGITGKKAWYNATGAPNKPIGPTFVHADGKMEFFKNGMRHRIDGPAVIESNGKKLYYINGYGYNTADEYWEAVQTITQNKKSTPKKSRKKYTNADYEKMSFAEIYSEYKTGDKDEDGNVYYISPTGTKTWRDSNAMYNKKTGPAIVHENGEIYWYRQNAFHRLDGPAYIDPSGKHGTAYYIHGSYYPESDYWKKVQEITGKTKEEITGKATPSPVQKEHKKYTNAEYEKMSFAEIYSDYKNGDKDEEGNTFFTDSISKSWRNSLGEFNKTNGPARLYSNNGPKYWYQDNKFHRLDGPAVVNLSYKQQKLYYIDGIQYIEEKYWKKVNEISGETKGDYNDYNDPGNDLKI